MASFLNTWLPIVSALIGIIIPTISFLIPFVKNVKAKKALETALKIAEAVQPYIIKAEEYTHYSGDEKKDFVMTKANQYAIENKLKFDVNAVSQYVEQLVALTKKVNQREKDKAQPETVVIA